MSKRKDVIMSERSGFWPMVTGLVLGTVAGAGAMFFLNPQSGKKNQQLVKKHFHEIAGYLNEEKEDLTERVQEIFGDVNELTQTLYDDARHLWDQQVKTFNHSMKKIDKKGYQEIVDNVVEKLQVSKKYPSDEVSKVKRYLSSQWQKFSDEIAP